MRTDICDYYWEVQRFNREVGQALSDLEKSGELDNTIIVMTGDHGMPFPRCKANLYDMGVRIPLAIRWGNMIKPGRRVSDFVSLTDLAPTFLEATGVKIHSQMTGQSLMKILLSRKSGQVDPDRHHIIFGRERHVPCQTAPSLEAYPARGIRNNRWLYICNLKPSLWPVGVPGNKGTAGSRRGFGDCDDGPTKFIILEHKDKPSYQRYYYLCFGQRPEEELYDCNADPYQLNNLASDPAYAKIKSALRAQLMNYLRETNDPRITGQSHQFDTLPYPLRD